MIKLLKFCVFSIAVFLMGGCTQNVHHHGAELKKSGDILTLLDPETKTEQQALAKAEAALKEGNTEVARFYFVKVLQFNKNNIYALEQIAAIHGLSGKHELAVKIYKQILAIDSLNESANEKLGLYALKNGRLESAKQFLSKAVIKNDSHWRSHNGLGIIADLEKDHVSALYHYWAALNVQPNSPLLLNNLGYSYYLSGNLAKAKEFFNYALMFDHQHERAIHNLALIEIKHNAFANAYALFNRVMKPYEAWNNIGYLCMINEQYGPAEKYLRKAIRESPVYFPKAQENLKALMSLKKSLKGDNDQDASALYSSSGQQNHQAVIRTVAKPGTSKGNVKRVSNAKKSIKPTEKKPTTSSSTEKIASQDSKAKQIQSYFGKKGHDSAAKKSLKSTPVPLKQKHAQSVSEKPVKRIESKTNTADKESDVENKSQMAQIGPNKTADNEAMAEAEHKQSAEVVDEGDLNNDSVAKQEDALIPGKTVTSRANDKGDRIDQSENQESKTGDSPKKESEHDRKAAPANKNEAKNLISESIISPASMLDSLIKPEIAQSSSTSKNSEYPATKKKQDKKKSGSRRTNDSAKASLVEKTLTMDDKKTELIEVKPIAQDKQEDVKISE